MIALSIARMGDSIGNSLLFIVLPLYVEKLPEELTPLPLPVMVGILISVYGFVNSGLQPFAGALSDRLGKRKLLIMMGLALMALGTAGFVVASRFVDLFVLRMIQGVGIALTVPAAMALMAEITVKESRGGAMGVYTTLRLIGFTAGPLVGGFLQVHYGFDAAFVVGAGFLGLAMVIVQLWVKDIERDDVGEQKRKFKLIDRSMMSAGLLSAAFATFLMGSAFSMVTTLENEFNARLGINALGFGVAFSSLMAGRLLLQLPAGHFADVIGRKPVVLIGLGLMAPITALLGEVTTLWELVVLRVLQGIATAAIAAPAFAVAGDLSKAGGEGRQMSLVTIGFGLGIAVGPLVAGILATLFFELPFLVNGLMCLAGVLVVFKYMPETIEGKKVMFRRTG